MGRKSKLSPVQWAEVERRLLEGESRTSLGREFGISEAAIREKFSGQVRQIKDVAAKIVETERALAALPPMAQISANNLAQKLLAISNNLANAAELGSATAHRLQALANSEVIKVDDASPLASLENLRNVGVLTKLANESAAIALNLLAANKDSVKKVNDEAAAANATPAPLAPQLTYEQWAEAHGLA